MNALPRDCYRKARSRWAARLRLVPRHWQPARTSYKAACSCSDSPPAHTRQTRSAKDLDALVRQACNAEARYRPGFGGSPPPISEREPSLSFFKGPPLRTRRIEFLPERRSAPLIENARRIQRAVAQKLKHGSMHELLVPDCVTTFTCRADLFPVFRAVRIRSGG